LITSKLRLLPAKRRTRRSAQLAARENKTNINMNAEPTSSTRPRNVLVGAGCSAC